MTLWTPANLAVQPKSIFDPSTFTFSGSAFSSGSDQGSFGGSFSGSAGQSTFGGINVATFNGSSQQLAGPSKSWTAGDDVFIFLVVQANKLNPGAVVSQAWGTATTGWVLYPSLTSGGSTNGGQKSWVAGDSVAFGSGFGSSSVQNVTIGHSYTSNAAYHLLALKVGAASLYRLDGVAQTPGSVVGANPAVAASVIWGNDAFGTEWFTGAIAYGLVAVNPSASEIEELEGWASWNFTGSGSMLPIGHTYKSAAPTLGTIITQDYALGVEAGASLIGAARVSLETLGSLQAAGLAALEAQQASRQDAIARIEAGAAQRQDVTVGVEAHGALRSDAQVNVEAKASVAPAAATHVTIPGGLSPFFSTLTSAQPDPDGGTAAIKIVASAVNNVHGANTGPAGQNGRWLFSAKAKAGGQPRFGMRVYDGVAYQMRTTFDITNGTIVLVEAGFASIAPLVYAPGWYLCRVWGSTATGNMGAISGFALETVAAGQTVQTVFLGDGVSGAFVYDVVAQPGFPNIDLPAGAEWGQAARSDGLATIEAAAAARSDALVRLEAGGALVGDGRTAIEARGSLQGDTPARVEWIGSLRTDATTAIEAQATLRSDVGARLEAEGVLVGDARPVMEAKATLTGDAPARVEALGSFEADALGRVEALQAVQATASIHAEHLTGVAGAALMALEWVRFEIRRRLAMFFRGRAGG